jgi:hypothetical protein
MAVNIIQIGQRFRYQPIPHDQALAVDHVEDWVALCQTMLRLRDNIPLIYFSGESPFVLIENRRWLWDQKSQENLSASTSPTK